VRSIAPPLSVAAALLLVSCSSSPSSVRSGPDSRTPSTSSLAQLESRPLHLPAFGAALACPTAPGEPASAFSPFGTGFTPGRGPVYPVLGEQFLGAAVPAKVLWIARPSYQGPVVIRGKQIDGSAPVTFGAPPQTLQVLSLTSAGVDLSGGAGWRAWPSYTYVVTPGCYAYQVDGDGFSETIVFRASLGPLGQPRCHPPSPGSYEVEGTSPNADLWALVFASQPHAGDEVKIVWRMTGAGSFRIAATGPAGTLARLTFGPDGPRGSTWTRPGHEWGTSFVFPVADAGTYTPPGTRRLATFGFLSSKDGGIRSVSDPWKRGTWRVIGESWRALRLPRRMDPCVSLVSPNRNSVAT
jgi:hypothetical protein